MAELGADLSRGPDRRPSAGVVGQRGSARGRARRGLRLPRRSRTRNRRIAAGGRAMRVALYARVSTERQQERGTVASQLELLRAAARADDHQVVAEFVDDGYSGARLDRPALDRLRDAAEAGALDTVLCLCADRLARAYAYQVLILDELERFGVQVHFLDGPAPGDDPQARLLVQVQGVIAEYERAKIAERYRRGKLHRARAGEVFFWKVPYGYRRIAAEPGRPARMEIFEPEAEIVRAIFAAHADHGASIRQICHDLLDRGIPSPTGKPVWGTSTLQRLLVNEAYIGRVYYNRRETINGAPPAAARAAPRRATANDRASNGSRSPSRASSTPTPSSAPSTLEARTSSGARAGSSPGTGCCAA